MENRMNELHSKVREEKNIQRIMDESIDPFEVGFADIWEEQKPIKQINRDEAIIVNDLEGHPRFKNYTSWEILIALGIRDKNKNILMDVTNAKFVITDTFRERLNEGERRRIM